MSLRCLIAWTFLHLNLFGADLAIDHVTLAGRNLQAMRAALDSIGLPSVFGGSHGNGATEMASISFQDGSYLELIAREAKSEDSAVARHPWAQFLNSDAGPCAWAVRAKDAAAEAARLKAAGIEAGAPGRGGRIRPDGVKLEWETVQVGAARGTFFPFLIQDITPRKDRAFTQGKPSDKDYSGVTRVVIAVRNLDDAIDRYRRAYGLERAIKQVDAKFGAHLALLGGTPVILAAPLSASSWLAKRLDQFGELPCAFILGSRRAAKTDAAGTRWFGVDIRWFDAARISGWRLGFE